MNTKLLIPTLLAGIFTTLCATAHAEGELLAASPTASAPKIGDHVMEDASVRSWLEPKTLTCDLALFGAFRAGEKDYFTPNMAGLELTAARYFTSRQAFTVSLSIAAGNRDKLVRMLVNDHPYAFYDYTRVDTALMAGYRYTQPLGERAFLSLGVKGGLDVQYLGINDTQHYEWNGEEYVDEDDVTTLSAGWAYAAYAELGLPLGEWASFTIGYQFQGATSRPKTVQEKHHPYVFSTKAMLWHEVRMGINVRF